jgi:DNA replication protein DnaC
MDRATTEDPPPRDPSPGRRLRLACFEEQTTVESFDFTANPTLPAAAHATWPDRAGWTLGSHPLRPGVGKTHIAQALDGPGVGHVPTI